MRNRVVTNKVNREIAEGLIGHTIIGRYDFGIGKFLGFNIILIFDQLTDFSNRLINVFADIIIGAASPDRIVIYLEALLLVVTKNHRSQRSITNGQSVVPVERRLIVPKH